MTAEPATNSGDAAYDIVILGGGSGGYACALRAAELGLRVALVERDKLGGTCLHRGCIPTKALLHAAEVADTTREAGRFGIVASLDGIDLGAVSAYRDSVVSRLYKGLQGLVASRSIDLVQGVGRLSSASTVTVEDRVLTGRHIVLATGSYARTLPGIEIAGRIMTSDQALELDQIPRRVIVLGGGVIGVEFASVFRSFGAEVTIVEALPRLVAAEDPAVSTALERAFRKRKIGFRTGAMVESATQDDAEVHVHLDGLGYAECGLTLDRGYVITDEHCRTGVDGVYAVGDIVPGLQLAHRGFAQGIFVAEEIAGLSPTPIVESSIPRVTYCEPEIASVGLTETQAREQHAEIETYEYNLGGNGKSQILGTAGFVKLVRIADGPVVGVHMVGSRMGEQIGEAQLIVGWEATPEDVSVHIHAHPTQNEALGEAHLALAGKPLHAHN